MKQPETKSLSPAERKALQMKEAHGPARVLCVGVDEYTSGSGFPKLKKCSEDALQVCLAFKETPQLNASADFTEYITSERIAHPPTKGYIISKLKELAAGADEGDRIIFYFSGHGHRIAGDDNFYLVPQDAYDESEPEALLSLDKVTEILRDSDAKQIIVILDACLSGPTLLKKKLAAASSDKQLIEYMKQTKGVAFLSSSEPEQASFEKSQHPKLSLFTSILVPAIKGHKDALDDSFLTLPSLYDYISTNVIKVAKSMQLKQRPSLHNQSNGTFVLGDFRPDLTPKNAPLFTEYATNGMTLSEETEESIKSILTNLFRKGYSAGQLAYAAQKALGDYLEEDFSKYRSELRKKLNFAGSEVEVSDSYISFPGGSIEYQVEENTTHSCLIVRDLTIDMDWFDKPEELKCLTKIFRFRPDTLTLHLCAKCEPLQHVTAFESIGWEAISEREDLVKFEWEGIAMELSATTVHFTGLTFNEFFDLESEENTSVAVLSETLEIVSQ